MSEFLVLLSCYNHAGCTETSSQYYAQHKEFQEFVRTEEDQIKRSVGPIVTQYWAPVMWAAAGQEANIRLSARFYLTFRTDKQIVTFKQEF